MTRVVYPEPGAAERLCQIERAAYAKDESAWSAADYIALGAPPEAAIIADDKVERGMLLLRFAADEGEVLNLAVIPEARGQGLGRALLVDGIALARNLKIARLFLEVAIDNTPALALYRSCGFGEIGRRNGYYRRPDGSRVDAILMTMVL